MQNSKIRIMKRKTMLFVMILEIVCIQFVQPIKKTAHEGRIMG